MDYHSYTIYSRTNKKLNLSYEASYSMHKQTKTPYTSVGDEQEIHVQVLWIEVLIFLKEFYWYFYFFPFRNTPSGFFYNEKFMGNQMQLFLQLM